MIWRAVCRSGTRENMRVQCLQLLEAARCSDAAMLLPGCSLAPRRRRRCRLLCGTFRPQPRQPTVRKRKHAKYCDHRGLCVVMRERLKQCQVVLGQATARPDPDLWLDERRGAAASVQAEAAMQCCAVAAGMQVLLCVGAAAARAPPATHHIHRRQHCCQQHAKQAP